MVIIAKFSVLRTFYAGESWQKFRAAIIAERGLRCEHCGKLVVNASDMTVHHVKELTPENVHDVHISLNPENVKVVHHECHNIIHNRFGYRPEHKVYIIFGPPLSGKTTYVRENMCRGDLVVDMDGLYAAVSFMPAYDKPDNLLQNVFALQNLLIDNIKTRYGKWYNAWIIGTYPDKYKREKLAEDLGAELIFCDVSKDECLRRLGLDEVRQYRRDEWTQYIDKWFEGYMA